MCLDESQRNNIIYLVMQEGAVYLATDDEEFADRTLAKLENDNIRYIEDEYDLDEEESPLTVDYLANREGDHVYLDSIPEGFAFFDTEEEYITNEGDSVTESDVEMNFLRPEDDEDDEEE